MNETKQKLYTLAEITEYLQLGRDKVLALIQNEKLPAHKIGRQWRFYLHEVDEWVKRTRDPKND